MANEPTSIRIDSRLKDEFKLFCERAGISVSGAISLFMFHTVKSKKVPFEIAGADRIKGAYEGGEPQMTRTAFRIEKQLKDDYALICAEMGINRSMLIKIFMKRCVDTGKLPFEPMVITEN